MHVADFKCKCGRHFYVQGKPGIYTCRTCNVDINFGEYVEPVVDDKVIERVARLNRVRDAGARQRWVVRALKTRGALPVVVDQLLNSPETRPTLRKYVAALLNECGCDYQTALKELSKRFPD